MASSIGVKASANNKCNLITLGGETEVVFMRKLSIYSCLDTRMQDKIIT
jgi:hypothetical protein